MNAAQLISACFLGSLLGTLLAIYVEGEVTRRMYNRRMSKEFGQSLPDLRTHDSVPMTCGICGKIRCHDHF